MNTALVICGPTATGKTALATLLAKRINGELVSADSRQIYKDMDIGTGKDLPLNSKIQITNFKCIFKDISYTLPVYQLHDVPIWMLDVIHPNENFSISHYVTLARQVIADILKRKKTPIIVGGTGQYIDALIHPPQSINISPDPALRLELSGLSMQELQKKLSALNASAWEGMNNSDKNNPRRLTRRIEIELAQGKEGFIRDSSIDIFLEAHFIGLTTNSADLYRKIDERVDARVSGGIISEIEKLSSLGYSWDLPSMSGLGYKEWKSYITQGKSEAHKLEAIQKWKYDEHAYARRQMTWFKKNSQISWFDITSASLIQDVTENVLPWYTKG